MMPHRRPGLNPEFLEFMDRSCPVVSVPCRLRRRGSRSGWIAGAVGEVFCVWGLGLVEASTSAGNERREGGSLHGRLRFAGLDEAASKVVRDHRNLLLPHVKAALRDLFHRFQSFPEASRHFESDGQLERLHDLNRSHWDVLTDARFDALYAERVKVLADAERRMGLDPRWHIAGHAVVLEHLVSGLIDEFWQK